jgi:hypothetical protein
MFRAKERKEGAAKSAEVIVDNRRERERKTKLINPFLIHTSLEPSKSTPKAWAPRRWSENTVSKTDQTAQKK